MREDGREEDELDEAGQIRSRWGIVANHVHHRYIREGAKCWVNHYSDPDHKRVQVLVKAGGRWCRPWTRMDRLTNFRAAMIPPTVDGPRLPGLVFDSKAEANAAAARIVAGGFA